MEPKTIADRAAKLGFPAIAVTDRNGLYGVMPFSDACIAKGVQPIVGAMLAVARPAGTRRRRRESTGWCCSRRTIKATPISASSSRRPTSTARSRRNRMSNLRDLRSSGEGLIALTAGAEGALARLIADGQQLKAEAYLDRLQAAFPGPPLYRDRRGAATWSKKLSEAALIELAYARRPPARRDQPRGVCRPILPRGSRRDAVHCEFRICRKRRPRQLVSPTHG